MAEHLFRDLEHLKKKVLTIGATVEEATNKAISALMERRVDLAREVIAGDDEIDELEVSLEEDCLKVLALHHPVAADLRFTVMVLKVNNDLERVGDLASNIAVRAIALADQPRVDVSVPIPELSEMVRNMVRRALDSLVRRDVALAKEICKLDKTVDAMHREMYTIVQRRITAEPGSIERFISLLSVSRYLERIADLATNIAEDVIFMVTGEVVRHQPIDSIRKR